MNQTIRLYTNITETRHRKHLEIVKSLDSIQNKIVRLKKWIIPYLGNLNINAFTSLSDDTFEIILRTSQYPIQLFFYLPQNVYDEFIMKSTMPEYPILLLDYIYKVARKEYNEIGKRYNKISSSNIGKSRTLRW